VKAPDFSLLDQNGNSFVLSENLEKNILLVFYPKDNSPVCTKQLKDYNDNLEKFIKANVKVVGISVDNLGKHKLFASKLNLNFPILVDTNKQVSKLYNALSFTGMSKRKLVLIDKEGEIIFEKSMLPIHYKNTDFLLYNVIQKLMNDV